MAATTGSPRAADRRSTTRPGRGAVLLFQPLKRLARPEVSSVVAFLGSDDACWIIGDTLYVDGGSTANCRSAPKMTTSPYLVGDTETWVILQLPRCVSSL